MKSLIFPALGLLAVICASRKVAINRLEKEEERNDEANRLSFFRPVSWNDLFQSFRRQDGSQVDLTLRVIAHTFEQGTEEKVRHLFITRPVNFNIVLLFFSFLLYHVSRYNYQPFYS